MATADRLRQERLQHTELVSALVIDLSNLTSEAEIVQAAADAILLLLPGLGAVAIASLRFDGGPLGGGGASVVPTVPLPPLRAIAEMPCAATRRTDSPPTRGSCASLRPFVTCAILSAPAFSSPHQTHFSDLPSLGFRLLLPRAAAGGRLRTTCQSRAREA